MTLHERKTRASAGKGAGEIRMCTDRHLPREHAAAAEAAAIDERPDNMRLVPIGPRGPGRARMAIVVASEWKPGTTLHVKFLDGDKVVKQKVEMVAHGWEDVAYVRFAFDDRADAQIRISFLQEGSWSYIGKDALQIPAKDPTMNYGWLKADTEDEEYSRVVLHESATHSARSTSTRAPASRSRGTSRRSTSTTRSRAGPMTTPTRTS